MRAGEKTTWAERGQGRGENDGQRLLCAWGHPIALSAGQWFLSGQAHAKHAHRWIPPQRNHCPIGEPPEPGPQTPPGFSQSSRGRQQAHGPRGWHPPTTIIAGPPLPSILFNTCPKVVLGGRGLRVTGGVLTLERRRGAGHGGKWREEF